MICRIALITLLAAFVGCKQAEPEKQKKQIWHPVKCQGCGSEYESTAQNDVIERCPNCPSTACNEGGVLVMEWAAVHTDESRSAEAKKKLEAHMQTCEGCRKEFTR